MRKLKNNVVTRILGIFLILGFISILRWISDNSIIDRTSFALLNVNHQSNQYRRDACSCFRPLMLNSTIIDETSTSFCSQYATFRGFHQRIIAISMYGPKENLLFGLNTSFAMLNALIDDMMRIYPEWILRIYHDTSIREDLICSIQCRYNHVDFCNASSLLSLGNVANYIPPKIWRFLPIGDPFVDIIASRDLDSPLIPRELAAVNEWLTSNKSWHVMRDHPFHTVPMLGGLWAFRSVQNRMFARILFEKIMNRSLISHYGARNDQTFLTEHVWPYIQTDLIAHDSHLCTTSYGLNSRPWPTRRPLLNETDCFVGCIRPCCPPIQHPFGECPLECRPKNHPDWTMC